MGELVIATCKEDLSWIDGVAKDYERVTVYDKCDVRPEFHAENVDVQTVPNVGSCDNAFLTYITDRYDSLPDRVNFTKGTRGNIRPIECASLQEKNHAKCANDMLYWKIKDWSFTHNKTQDFPFMKVDRKNMREWVESDTLLSTEMYEDSACNLILGGHFSASREQIRNMPKEVYANLKEQQRFANEEIDHYIERSWGTMFCTQQQPQLVDETEAPAPAPPA